MTNLTCLRCGHTWEPRINKRPIQCPVCKSPQWDKPRKDNYKAMVLDNGSVIELKGDDDKEFKVSTA